MDQRCPVVRVIVFFRTVFQANFRSLMYENVEGMDISMHSLRGDV